LFFTNNFNRYNFTLLDSTAHFSKDFAMKLNDIQNQKDNKENSNQ